MSMVNTIGSYMCKFDTDGIMLGMLLAEADRYGLLDKEWYKGYLKKSLEALHFEHFSEQVPDARISMEEPKVIRVRQPINNFDDLVLLDRYIREACKILNQEKGLQKYSPGALMTVFTQFVAKHSTGKVTYVDALSRMSDSDLCNIRGIGPKRATILKIARDLANADVDCPYNAADLHAWSQGLMEKYKKEEEKK